MLDTNQQVTKIAIIGAGRVGASCAYALQLRGLASEIVLINAHPERAEGEAMDLNHGSLFARPVRVWAGDFSDCRGADVIVLAAGAAQQPGEFFSLGVDILCVADPKLIVAFTRWAAQQQHPIGAFFEGLEDDAWADLPQAHHL